jgi:PREDICTED: similar to connectin/titin
MNKKFLFVLLLVFLGTYKAEVKATSERSFATEFISSEGMIAPFFSTPLKNVVAQEGEYVTMQARVGGKPLPLIRVFKGDIEIIPSDEIEVTILQSIVTITIKDVHSEDAGEYIIVLTNAAGTVRSSCYLTVIDSFI